MSILALTSGFTKDMGHVPLNSRAASCPTCTWEATLDLLELPAEWGVTITFSILNNGLSGDVGSTSKTSSPAPAISPFCSAAMRASSSTVHPLQVLTKYADVFMALKKSAPTSLVVWLLKGVCIETKSEFWATSVRLGRNSTLYSLAIQG